MFPHPRDCHRNIQVFFSSSHYAMTFTNLINTINKIRISYHVTAYILELYVKTSTKYDASRNNQAQFVISPSLNIQLCSRSALTVSLGGKLPEKNWSLITLLDVINVHMLLI